MERYREKQNEEEEVLRSVFGDDFEELPAGKSAWARPAEKAFKLRLRPRSDPSTCISLVVTMTATYPETIPLLRLEGEQGIRPKYRDQIIQAIKLRPKSFLGEVMIYDISCEILDILEDAALAKAEGSELPSLEEERAAKEMDAAKQALEREAMTKKRELEEVELKELDFQKQVEEERKKREQTRAKQRELDDDGDYHFGSWAGDVVFDTTATVRVADNMQRSTRIACSSVVVSRRISGGAVTDVLLASPAGSARSVDLVIKRAKLASSDTCDRTNVYELENLLETLKNLHYDNAMNVLNFRIQPLEGFWNIDILCEFGDKGSLWELLQTAETLLLPRGKSLSVDLLQALEFYHKHGIVHGRIHTRNVLFCRSAIGSTVVKLADVGFQASISSLQSSSSMPPDVVAEGWLAPERSAGKPTSKTDVWDIGVVIANALLGLGISKKYSSPTAMANDEILSKPLRDVVYGTSRVDPKERTNASDLASFEFFRKDVGINAERPSTSLGRRFSTDGSRGSLMPRLRHQYSSSDARPTSRYTSDWVEMKLLGRGGYGEVVQARNKLDGHSYAIKKITKKTPTELNKILSEVRLLAALKHPFVVRYYTAWDEPDAFDDGSSSINTISTRSDYPDAKNTASSLDYGVSAGLDFMSSGRYGAGDEDDDENSEMGSETDEFDSESENESQLLSGALINSVKANYGETTASSNGDLQRMTSESYAEPRSTLYIQMEYCEKRTLGDLIRDGLSEKTDTIWRIFRQILEGLEHIHISGIIHRDLKPANIFIDVADDPQIGDFGLATTSQYRIEEKTGDEPESEYDMTSNIGTTFYVAPELKSNTGGFYTNKVDMYSLGIIFFEMCQPFSTGSERIHLLSSLRESHGKLPREFSKTGRELQTEIIESLIKERPAERPSSSELLRNGKVPIRVEDETIRVALQGLADEGSPTYHKMMSILFSNSINQRIRDQVWDTGSNTIQAFDRSELLLQGIVKDKLVSCFRRHGAVETQRPALIPRSDRYTGTNIAQVLDASGTLLQLPFDLTLPYARTIARRDEMPEKTFTFGLVYRDPLNGGAPQSLKEADFDIVSTHKRDPALREAEVIKVTDEILEEFPSTCRDKISFHISHSKILDIIMNFCRIPVTQRAAVKDVVGKLNIQNWTWAKIRSQLRSSSVGISAMCLDELQRFDFRRDTPDRFLSKMKEILNDTEHIAGFQEAYHHLSSVFEYCKVWGVRRPLHISPLSSFNHKHYEGGVMFQCLFDGRKKDVIAAGGRYDKMIEDFKPRANTANSPPTLHAVGVNIAWDKLVASMLRYLRQSQSEEAKLHSQWAQRHCDVLVASFQIDILRSIGIKLVKELLAQDISAELATHFRNPDELYSHYRNEQYSWVIIVKHDVNKNPKPDLKIKSNVTKQEFDVRSTELMSFMRGEIRERDQIENTNDRLKLLRPSGPSEVQTTRKRGEVRVLQAQHRSKKTNKYRMVETAQTRARELTEAMAEGPIVSIETRDEVLDQIRETRLSDPESWRKVAQDVPLSERQYLQEVQREMERFKIQHGEQNRNAFIYNYRTGKCIHYDLLL